MTYCVSVRALCNFTAKHGDLDLRFTPHPSASEGMAGHVLVASRRDAGYLSEVTLEGAYKTLTVRGRADGYDPVCNQLEEVKTYRGDLHTMADNRRALHWAQVKIYGWLLCQSKGLKDINLALVYFDIADTQETPLVEHFTAAALKEYFEQLCELFLAWAERELAHRTARDAALTTLAFPHATFRPGQRELAEAVYKTASNGKCLMAQATTGIGKTIGAVFPLLKAMPSQRLDKLFFLAAKTPGRKLALDAFELVEQSANVVLRVVELVARDKSCEHPDKACHGDSCPLAKGFYDRLPQARYAAAERAASGALNKTAMRDVALKHHICPYYLTQEMATWADVVVADYNYYFDTSAMLHAMAANHQWHVGVLVDEAHNMVERARSMYSASLHQSQLQAVHAVAPKAVQAALARLNRAFGDVHKTQVIDYLVLDDLPTEFLKSLQQAITAVTDFLVANPTRMDGDLQSFYFEALHFSRLAETFGAHSIFDITLHDDVALENPWLAGTQGCATLNIRNVVPAPFLSPRFTDAHSVALFSATLSPPDFYKEILGLPATTAWIDVASPFSANQLAVSAVCNVSTRFNDRDKSLPLIAEMMARQYRLAPGNYLAFTSSYDYLQKLSKIFARQYPLISTWVQNRQMSETDREQFLSRFGVASQGIGFAVLGGAFAEGIDLPGTRLIGAFVATLGFPQVNAVNEEIRTRMAAYFDNADDGSNASEEAKSRAYNYTYLYPGLQKVVQAAGRVIRTQQDTGVVFLMDDRFTRPEVQNLLPQWWRVQTITQTSRPPEKPVTGQFSI